MNEHMIRRRGKMRQKVRDRKKTEGSRAEIDIERETDVCTLIKQRIAPPACPGEWRTDRRERKREREKIRGKRELRI